MGTLNTLNPYRKGIYYSTTTKNGVHLHFLVLELKQVGYTIYSAFFKTYLSLANDS